MKIVAVVPTYNRKDALMKNLDCLLKQSRSVDKIIVVDNASTPETKSLMASAGHLTNPKINYVQLSKNVGSAGGFKTGMEVAIRENADWIWGMDDDAFPRFNALEELLTANVSATYDCLWSNADEDISFDGPIKNVNHLMFVGFFVSKKLVETIGYPDTEFFLYHDDTEYSNRIIKNGYTIVKVRDSIIDHMSYDQRYKQPKMYKFPFGSFSVMFCEEYRLYYIYRNTFYVRPTGVSQLKYLIINTFINYPLYLINRPGKSFVILLATYHCIIGRRGAVTLPPSYYIK